MTQEPSFEQNNSPQASGEVVIGAIYRHETGFLYRVDSIKLDATGYESGQKPHKVIGYTQLTAGKYPEGTEWIREEKDFLDHFSIDKVGEKDATPKP